MERIGGQGFRRHRCIGRFQAFLLRLPQRQQEVPKMAHKIKTYRGVNWKVGLLEVEARVLKAGCDEMGGLNCWVYLSRISLHFINFPCGLLPLTTRTATKMNGPRSTATVLRVSFLWSRIVDSHGAEGQKVYLSRHGHRLFIRRGAPACTKWPLGCIRNRLRSSGLRGILTGLKSRHRVFRSSPHNGCTVSRG